MTLSSSSDRQEGPAGDHLGGGLRGSSAEAAEGQTDAERDGRVYPREVTVSFHIQVLKQQNRDCQFGDSSFN